MNNKNKFIWTTKVSNKGQIVIPKEAREIFNSKGFPRLKGTGTKHVADKRAVLLYELGLKEEEKKEVLKEMARQII